MKILVVEDDPDNLEMICVILGAEGHQTVACPDAHKALAAALDGGDPFDLAVMDVCLPGLDGLEAIRRLRADERTNALPVLCLSGSARLGEAEEARRSGANHYLAKPFRRKELLAAIDRTLGGS